MQNRGLLARPLQLAFEDVHHVVLDSVCMCMCVCVYVDNALACLRSNSNLRLKTRRT